jgi:hypothetical protein
MIGVFLHENPILRTAARTRALLEHLNWELFDQPHPSPDLAPSDWYLYEELVGVTEFQQ